MSSNILLDLYLFFPYLSESNYCYQIARTHNPGGRRRKR
ncbi:hypothetical protein VIBNISFn118_630003 [Vibrio nigripulchritudo SFn118]|nr:hypothetical protein VIBNISFn118_630003 [Vibrio nigripulchritudo SFn118]